MAIATADDLGEEDAHPCSQVICRLLDAEHRGRDILVVDHPALNTTVLQGNRTRRQFAQCVGKPVCEDGRILCREAVFEIDGFYGSASLDYRQLSGKAD